MIGACVQGLWLALSYALKADFHGHHLGLGRVWVVLVSQWALGKEMVVGISLHYIGPVRECLNTGTSLPHVVLL